MVTLQCNILHTRQSRVLREVRNEFCQQPFACGPNLWSECAKPKSSSIRSVLSHTGESHYKIHTLVQALMR